MKPFLQNKDASVSWKRFNIPNLRRTIERMEKQDLVELVDHHGEQLVRITKAGRHKILNMALVSLGPQKPKVWNRHFTLVSFDLPEYLAGKRKHLASYLKAWNFYPLQKSVYLHAYPCRDELDMLCEHLAIRQYVWICTVVDTSHPHLLRGFFDLS